MDGPPAWRVQLGRADVRTLTLLGVLAVLVLIGGITQPDSFLDTRNLQLVLTQASVIGVVTVGMTFVIISGGIDLSVGAIVAWHRCGRPPSPPGVRIRRHPLHRRRGGSGLRTGQRGAHRLRPDGALHRHPRHAGSRPRPRAPDHRRPHPGRHRAQRPGPRRTRLLHPRHPAAGPGLRGRHRHRLAGAEPDHLRTPHRRRGRQTRRPPGWPASTSAASGSTSTCCPGCAAASRPSC